MLRTLTKKKTGQTPADKRRTSSDERIKQQKKANRNWNTSCRKRLSDNYNFYLILLQGNCRFFHGTLFACSFHFHRNEREKKKKRNFVFICFVANQWLVQCRIKIKKNENNEWTIQSNVHVIKYRTSSHLILSAAQNNCVRLTVCQRKNRRFWLSKNVQKFSFSFYSILWKRAIVSRFIPHLKIFIATCFTHKMFRTKIIFFFSRKKKVH